MYISNQINSLRIYVAVPFIQGLSETENADLPVLMDTALKELLELVTKGGMGL